MRLLLNMNLPRDLCKLLNELDCECRHVTDLGMSSADDEEIIRYARTTGQVILTHDLDYGDLLSFSGEQFPSVVIFRMRDVSVGNSAHRFAMAWPDMRERLTSGAVVTITDQSIRVRRLPMRHQQG